MAVRDWFNKKRRDKRQEQQAPKPKQKKAPEAKQSDLIESLAGPAHQILHSPHVTEKSSMLADKRKYVFNVFRRANAGDVKRAVEEVYNVRVSDVHMITVPAKKRRRGRHVGHVARLPHAIVTVAEGETIDIMPQ